MAIKVLEKKRIIENEEDMERVQREIAILKEMRHEHVIRLLDIQEDDKGIYLIMEHAEKGELFDQIVEKGRLTEPEACRYLLQLLAGVDYLHR